MVAHSQIASGGANHDGPHLPGVSFAVKNDEPLDPFPVSLLGAQRVVLETHDRTYLVQQLELRVRNEAIARR